MPAAEFMEWVAFASIEPIGDARGDLQAAIGASVTANANRDSKKRREPFSPTDFIPTFEAPKSLPDKMRAFFGGLVREG